MTMQSTVVWVKKMMRIYPMRIFAATSALFFAAITIAVFFPTVFFGNVPLPTDLVTDYLRDEPRAGQNVWIRDTVVQVVSYEDYIFDEWKAGRVPATHGYLFGAVQNIQATGQVDVWAPINLLIPLFHSSISFHAFKILFYFWLSGFAMSLFLRGQRMHPGVAVFGGIAYQWAGPMIAWLTWGIIDGSWAWLPLLLFAAWQGITRAPQLRWILLGSVAWFGVVSAGHLQFAAFAAATGTLYTAALLAVVYPWKEWTTRTWVTLGACLLLCGVATLAIVQPFVAASPESHRATIHGVASLHPANLMQFILPNMWGLPNVFKAPLNSIETTAGVGTVALAAIVLRWAAARRINELRKQEWFWAALGGGVLLAIVFPRVLLPLYSVAPQFESYPLFRGLMVVSLSIIMLAVLALQWAVDQASHARRAQQWRWWAGGAVAVTLTVGVPAAVGVVLSDKVAADLWTVQLPIAAIAVLLTVVLIWAMTHKRIAPRVALTLMCLCALVQSIVTFYPYTPQQARAPLTAAETPAHIVAIQEDWAQGFVEGPGAVTEGSWKAPLVYSEVSPLNQYMYFNIRSLFGYDSNYPEWVYEEYTRHGEVKSHRNIINVRFEVDDLPYLQSKGINYIISKRDWPGLTVLADDNGIRVYSVLYQ